VPGKDKHIFQGDTSFSGPGDCLCWVDLLQGIVVCTNPWGPEDPEVRFIPLPDGCPAVSATDYPYRPRVEESRSAACVGGRIKFVAMVGELAGWNAHQFRLTTWTLSPDLSGWQQAGVFPLEDLWATEEYRALNLPQHTPVCQLYRGTPHRPGSSGCSGNRAAVQTPVCSWHRHALQQDRLHQLWYSAGKPDADDAPPPVY
jgi:hypothetical protein